MADWTVRKPRIDYSAADSMRDLTMVALDFLNKSLDRKSREKAYKLNILADDLRTASSDLRHEKKSNQQARMLHEELYGKSNNPNYTSKGIPMSEDVVKMHEVKIEDKQKRYNFYEEQTLNLLKEISFAKRAQAEIPKLSKALGKPNLLEPIDVTPERIASQLVVGTEDEMKRGEELITSLLKKRPELVSLERLEEVNLLAAHRKAQAAGYEWADTQRSYTKGQRKEAETKAIVASNLALSPFVSDVGSISRGEDSPSDQSKKIFALGSEYGLDVGNILLPDGSPEEKYNIIVRTYNAMASFGKGSTAPKDITGLGRLVDRLKTGYEGLTGSVGDISTPKGAYANWVSEMFNIDMENIDHLYFEGRIKPFSKEKKDIKISEFHDKTPGEILRIEFANSGQTQDEFLRAQDSEGNKKWEYYLKAFGHVYKDKKPAELRQMIFDSFKKKSEEDIAVIRKKLVDSGFPVVDVTADTGFFSVLAGGEARIRLAKPMADKFLKAKEILANKGIDLQIGDSFVHFDVKKKQYEDWVSGGKKGPIVAPPDMSFHTVGYAFDLEQTNEMKRAEVAEVMESLGLERSETEWWHWSLEEL